MMRPGDVRVFPPMNLLEAIHQPIDVWRAVEREIMQTKPLKAREAVELGGGQWQPEGWLHPCQPLYVFECLLALDVPVTRLFRAFTIAARGPG
jgi:hypothetical protein